MVFLKKMKTFLAVAVISAAVSNTCQAYGWQSTYYIDMQTISATLMPDDKLTNECLGRFTPTAARNLETTISPYKEVIKANLKSIADALQARVALVEKQDDLRKIKNYAQQVIRMFYFAASRPAEFEDFLVALESKEAELSRAEAVLYRIQTVESKLSGTGLIDAITTAREEGNFKALESCTKALLLLESGTEIQAAIDLVNDRVKNLTSAWSLVSLRAYFGFATDYNATVITLQKIQKILEAKLETLSTTETSTEE